MSPPLLRSNQDKKLNKVNWRWWYEDRYGYLLLLGDDVGRSCQYK